MRRFLVPLAALLLTACSQDFGLEGLEPDNGSDTLDTGADEQEEEQPAADEEEPEEDEPVDEEGEEPVDEEEEPEEDEPAPADDCEETDDRVYVIERDNNTVYLFDPEDLSFEALGRLSCGSGSTPGSMAVGRDGVAWVRSSDDRLYRVALDTLACSPTDFRLPAGFDSFGMGFATEHADTWRDHLFIADANTLARVDTGDMSVAPLGGMASQSELTGNNAGELWAFLPLESPALLIELDHSTGAQLDRISLAAFPPAGDIDAFAFATWGGDFWLFVRTYGMGSSTDVYRVTASGTMTRELVDVGFDVGGWRQHLRTQRVVARLSQG